MVRTEQDWLDSARLFASDSNFSASITALTAALLEYPASLDLRRALAGVRGHMGQMDQAEAGLVELHTEYPQDEATCFELARLLIDQGRMSAMASVLRDCMEHRHHHTDSVIRVIEMLDECDRIGDAIAVCKMGIVSTPEDSRLHAYAGMLLTKLGEFERAREHYLFAIQHSPEACEWRCPLGLANTQRYFDGAQPDFQLFRGLLQKSTLSTAARSTLMFALGKAYDDIADYKQAAPVLRDANSLAHKTIQWPRKSWRRAIETRFAPQSYAKIDPIPGLSPIFIVGMPRSGTTLAAELLSSNPMVCNRGESEWIARIFRKTVVSNQTHATSLRAAARTYAAHIRQDDSHARWYIDKQPLNFRYVDLIVALFPNAKIVHCERNPRDTALSLWMQWFVSEMQGYAYDFTDIAIVMRDCARLMAHWHDRFSGSIQTIRYEKLVSDSAGSISELAEWLQLPAKDPIHNARSAPINTASLWQARQPVHGNSVGRWKHYAMELPELMKFSAD